jgi:flagellar biosynthesis protein FliR
MIAGVALYFTLILARVGAFVAVMPLFSGRGMPRTVRVGLAMALAAFWFGTLTPPGDLGALSGAGVESWFLFAAVLMRESLIGGLAGLMFSIFLAPARIAGEVVTQQVGLAHSVVLGPSADTSGGPITMIFETLGGLLFMGLNGHHIVLAVLHASFAKYPLGGTMLEVPTEALVDGVASAEAMGIVLAGPLALALFLVTVVLALMARVAPQLNIFSVGFTVQALVALLVCFVLMPEVIATLTNFLGQLGELTTKVLG